ncbi:MAG TPA: site-specific integrase [Bacteroidia bacterium]|nr:site-specific integrase [Bacteroidia bacterium]HRS57986.1 site-specific integrase [Bacteroidia bacterium]HRU68559.1 site-specific integrase [Bacteroidia bacterium]
MTVYLRKKSLSDGRKSLYLDIYHNGRRYYEFLKIYLVKAITPEESKSNRENYELAKQIRAIKEIELNSQGTNYIPNHRKSIEFIEYFENFSKTYKNRDNRTVRACLNYFRKYLEVNHIKSLQCNELTFDHCKNFADFLTANLNGETPFNYFLKFKAVIKKAYKEKILSTNLAEDIILTRPDGIKKAILSPSEIQLLANTYCGNDELKRAFLFSLMTGIRFVDINLLKWKNIDFERKKCTFTQSKLKRKRSGLVTIPLNETALFLLGQPGKQDHFIFNLPSHTACLKLLRNWTKKAGIQKHITFHCARHSYAVNLLDSEGAGADVKTVAALMGHSNLKMMEVYSRVIDERLQKAVNSIPQPEIKIIRQEKI